jgi:hypothetical protein
VVFEDITNTRRKRTVDCTDGNSACDTDGAANGRCRFSFRLCVMQLDVSPQCQPTEITKIGKGRFNKPPLPATAPACGDPNQVDVRAGKTRAIRLTAKSTGNPRTDRDTVKLHCERGAASPAGAFLDGEL